LKIGLQDGILPHKKPLRERDRRGSADCERLLIFQMNGLPRLRKLHVRIRKWLAAPETT